jgi:hypothetical protein
VSDGDNYPGTPDWIPSEGTDLWSLVSNTIAEADDSTYIIADDEDVENLFYWSDPAYLDTAGLVRILVRMRSNDTDAYIVVTPYLGAIQVGISVTIQNTVTNTWETLAGQYWTTMDRPEADLADLVVKVQGFAASTIIISEMEIDIEAPSGLASTTTTTSTTTVTTTSSSTVSTISTFSTTGTTHTGWTTMSTTSTTGTSTTTATTPLMIFTTTEVDVTVEVRERNFRA